MGISNVLYPKLETWENRKLNREKYRISDITKHKSELHKLYKAEIKIKISRKIYFYNLTKQWQHWAQCLSSATTGTS